MSGLLLGQGRVCRECGCTMTTACLVNAAGLGPAVWIPCRWVEWDLCSGCLPGVQSVRLGDPLPTSQGPPIHGAHPTL